MSEILFLGGLLPGHAPVVVDTVDRTWWQCPCGDRGPTYRAGDLRPVAEAAGHGRSIVLLTTDTADV